VTSYILCDYQHRETFIFRIHNYLSSNPPLTTQLFICPTNILYQLNVWQHYNYSQYRKEWIPVQKTAVTSILAIIISTPFYSCSFPMVIAMTNTVCGVKKWPIWTQTTFFLFLTWTQFLAQLHMTRILWVIALNFFLWITFSCYTKAVTVQVEILLYIQTNLGIDPLLLWKPEHFPIRRYVLAQYSYIFTHSNNIRHVKLLRAKKLYETNYVVFSFFHVSIQ